MDIERCRDFFERLHVSGRGSLLLDYDGTLAPFRPERNQALPYSQVPETLQRIAEAGHTRMVFVTGRSAHELADLLRSVDLTCEIWGTHGAEHLNADGSYTRAPGHSQEATMLEMVAESLYQEGLGHCVELKPGSVAVHWRGMSPEVQAEARNAALRAFSFLSTADGYRCVEFDGGVELILGKWDKGQAVRAILEQGAASGPAAYLGDDISDEDAFRCLPDTALGVLVRPEFRPTAARMWLRPPEELLDFLHEWESACGGSQ